jgi:tRNA threonylcarbamoyladenosine biosynthesis protein TsaB
LTTTILAIDTAMAACSAAAWRDGILARRFEPMERGHAERIAPMVNEVMREAGLGFEALDRIAVTTGPGTFTGQRIGLSMARGLGLALGRPVVGVTTLETIAHAHGSSGDAIVVASDARRDEAYFAAFTDRLELSHAVAVLPLGTIALRLPPGRVRIAGSAADALIAMSGRPDLERARGADLPDATYLARIAARRPVSDAPPEPLYLRPPDAKPQTGSLVGQSIRVRRARQDDMPAISELHAQCFADAWGEAEFAKLLATPGTAAWLANDRDEATGFVLVRQAADEVEVLSLGTRPAARRRGIARHLMSTVSGAFPGSRAIFIEVAADNGPARALYHSLGFFDAGTRKAYYARPGGNRLDAIVMRKDLRP